MATTPVERSSMRPRTDAFTFILHWALVAALILSLLTGLRIAADYDGSVAGAISRKLEWLLLEGSVIQSHIWSGWTLTFIAVSYAAFLWRSRQAGRVKVDRSRWRRLRLAVQRGRFWSDVSAWFAANVLVYQIGFALIALMALTGWLLYSGFLGVDLYVMGTIHGIVAYSFLLYIAIHILAQLKAGTFWKIFQPRLDHSMAAGLAVIISGVAVIAVFLADRTGFVDLPIIRVAEPPPWTATPAIRRGG
jgi:cytochrome b subunit of formate dehydrogenase